MKRRRFLSVVAGLLSARALARAAGSEPLRWTHTIPLPGLKGRFDHFACHAPVDRLVVAALGNNTGEVFDVAEFHRVHRISGLRKPTGSLVLATPDRVFFANGDEGTLRGFDATTFAESLHIAGLDDADNVRYDQGAKLIYVGYGEGALGVVDPAAGQLLHSIPLAAHPESFQLEAHGPRIFVNIPEKKHVAVVDREKRGVVATWPMGKWQANFPMAFDEAAHCLFVGCRRPARLVFFDTARGVPVADLEISGDTDDLFFDARRERIYASCGEGFLDVIQRTGADRYERISRLATRPGARTCYFSPELDRLFLAVPESSGHAAELRVYQPE